jgi:hypothetical protein
VIVPYWKTYDPQVAPWQGGADLIDLNTGHRTVVPQTSALDGNHIAYLKQTGEIRVRDVATGHEWRVRRPGNYQELGHGPLDARLAIAGNLVLDVLGNSDGTTAEAVVINFVSHKRVVLTKKFANVWGIQAPATLVSGRVGWIDRDHLAVHVMALSDRRDHVLGHALRMSVYAFALADSFVAWIGADIRRHLVGLPH